LESLIDASQIAVRNRGLCVYAWRNTCLSRDVCVYERDASNLRGTLILKPFQGENSDFSVLFDFDLKYDDPRFKFDDDAIFINHQGKFAGDTAIPRLPESASA